MNIIDSLESLQKLVNDFKHSDTLTNNYIMLEDYQHYINSSKLAYQICGDNLVFLLKKEGFLQLYYYINNLSQPCTIDEEQPVVMEILYRGERYFPSETITFWKNNSFEKHLGRDMMAVTINKVTFPESLNEKVKISYPKSEDEIRYAFDLIRNTFDAYTGDILSLDQVQHYAFNNEILLAKIDDKCCGLLQLEIKNNVSWLGHVAVDSSYRKQGIANALVNAWIKNTAEQPSARYQLWVIQDNEPALNLYKNYGFIYANKSTISMLKR